MTESHLSEKISDHEINIEGWSSHRADRINRNSGGVITFCRENLIISDENIYSDSTSESLCLYISNMNMIMITIYRPPNCDKISFKNNLSSIDRWIEKIMKNHCDATICVTGDFNLGFLENWSHSAINDFVQKASERLENISKIAENKIQALELIEFCEKWCLFQQIEEYTRQNRILDLFLLNSDIVTKIEYISHKNLSDHETMVI